MILTHLLPGGPMRATKKLSKEEWLKVKKELDKWVKAGKCVYCGDLHKVTECPTIPNSMKEWSWTRIFRSQGHASKSKGGSSADTNHPRGDKNARRKAKLTSNPPGESNAETESGNGHPGVRENVHLIPAEKMPTIRPRRRRMALRLSMAWQGSTHVTAVAIRLQLEQNMQSNWNNREKKSSIMNDLSQRNWLTGRYRT